MSGAKGNLRGEPPEAILRRFVHLSEDEVAALDGRGVIARVLPTREPREVALCGLARLAVPPSFFADELRDIARFKRGENVTQVGRLHRPPHLADVKTLEMEPEDVAAFKKCRIADCDGRVPARVVARLHAALGASLPEDRDAANAFARQLLVDYATVYFAAGSAGLGEYDDGDRPVRLEEEVRGLVGESPYLSATAPDLVQYVLDFPARPLPGADDFVYWSVEDFGLRPFVSLTHVTIRPSPAVTIITSKQVYASRYFDGSLGLTVLVPAGDRRSRGCYLLYLNRSRTGALAGAFSIFRRAIAERVGRDGMEKHLRLLRDRLEGAGGDGGTQ